MKVACAGEVVMGKLIGNNKKKKQSGFRIESLADQVEAIRYLDDRIYEFNSSGLNIYDGELFTKVIRDETGNIIAGITGWTWAMISEITLLWVKEEHRGHGLGEMLLKAAEEEIIKKGCRTIVVRSYSFQAPEFYEKNGYKTVYILNDFPDSYRHHTLVKRVSTLID